MTGQKKLLEIYIHIPFCVRKCAYCDFLSAPADQETQRRYVDALLEEIENSPSRYEFYSSKPEVCSVFFGGGTPSVLPSSWIGEILDCLRDAFEIRPDAEITIECNPGTADQEKLSAYREYGINRISFGLQSAENRELQALGRIHSWESFLETYKAARAAGFININIDLMSALPGQTEESWEYTLRKVLELKPEHISAYSLIIEEGTPFYERYHEDDEKRTQGEQPDYLPSEDVEREMYRKTEQLLAGAGFHRYEISNYARENRECRHNIGYWTGVPYLGFGLGASSLWNHARYKNTESMEQYLESQKSRNAGIDQESLTTENEMEEFMFLGLRMIEGVSAAEFAQRFGREIEEIYGQQLDKLEKSGLIIRKERRIALTPAGLDVANPVMAEFLLE